MSERDNGPMRERPGNAVRGGRPDHAPARDLVVEVVDGRKVAMPARREPKPLDKAAVGREIARADRRRDRIAKQISELTAQLAAADDAAAQLRAVEAQIDE